MSDFDKRQWLDRLIERKDRLSLQALEAAVEIVNSLEDDEYKDWYRSQLAKILSQQCQWDESIQVADCIQDRVERAYAFLAITADLMTTKQRDRAVTTLTEAERAAFAIEGEGYRNWQRAEVLGRLGKAYTMVDEHARARIVWKEAIGSAQSGQKSDDPQEIWDCSGVLSEITTYLIEAGLVDLARETALSIRIDSKREGSLRRLARSNGQKPG